MATPYNPLANPYTINPRELPSNAGAAARVPAWNTIDPATGVAYSPAAWCYSPQYLPNWGAQVGTTPGTAGAQATSPVSTASCARPDATLADRQAPKVPAVQSIVPNAAVHAVATPIIINGYGLTGTTAVTVNGVACTAVVVINDGQISAVTGATTVAGVGNAQVTNPAGTGTGGTFTFS